MSVLESINEYVKYVKSNPYVYTIQKMGIEIFTSYINSNHLDEELKDIRDIDIDKLFLYWIPKNKKYLDEVQAYQVVYTVHDIYQYVLQKSSKNSEQNDTRHKANKVDKPNKKSSKSSNTPTILDLYGEEYMRVYKVRNMLLKVTKDPILSINPLIIDLDNYKSKKRKSDYVEMATTYEQAIFKVQECKEGGQVVLTKLYQDKTYKLLLEYPTYKYFKKGDLIHAVIKRKLFYVYWELEEVKSYYLPNAAAYL